MREHVSVRLSFPFRVLQGAGVAFATAAPHSDVPRCSYWIIQFVEAGYFLRDNFDELGTSFEDPYTHETYDLSQVLASFFWKHVHRSSSP